MYNDVKPKPKTAFELFLNWMNDTTSELVSSATSMNQKINIKQIDGGTFELKEDHWVCTHEDSFIEKACCAVGTEDCDCKGRDYKVCPNKFCTGLEESDYGL